MKKAMRQIAGAFAELEKNGRSTIFEPLLGFGES